jgi:hypothetical protein
MHSNLYSVSFSILIRPQWTVTPPEIELSFGDYCIFKGQLLEQQVFDYTSPAIPAGSYSINLKFTNKDYLEMLKYNKDMMVEVKWLKFENQPSNFDLYSYYQPDYPAEWASEQQLKNIKLEPTIHSNYLGWNGTWSVDVELPIFKWIHKTMNLGWLI